MNKNRPIFITGGHMTPALAVQQKLREEGFSKFVWIGHKYNQTHATTTSPEYKTVEEMEDTLFINLPAGKLVRSWYKSREQFLLAIKNILKIPYGFLLSLWLILRWRPLIIASFGGYLGLPVVICARILRIPAITHEQTIVTGMANRTIGRFANRIFISWPESAQYYPEQKTILSGNPIRPDVFEVKTNNLQFKNDSLPTIYITCGNQGAVVINRVVLAALPELLKAANIVHQTGSAATTQKLLSQTQIPTELPGQYIQQDYYFADEVGEAFSKADIVIARAGANTVSEVLALAKPTLFIPIPWVTQNEQYKNAKFAESLGIGRILPQDELDADSLTKMVLAIITDLNQGIPSAETKAKAAQVIPKEAANIIVKNMLDLI